jgi:hypothetical protein
MTHHAYLWQCPVTHNQAAVIAHNERQARVWFAAHTRPATPWQFVGEDRRIDAPYTLVLATLDEAGQVVTPALRGG